MKHDLSLGGFVDLRAYRTTGAQADDDPTVLAQFVAQDVPQSVNRVGPFVEYHSYRTRFVRMLDFQTLGLQEDYRLGHDLYVRVYPMPKALGSSIDALGVYAAASYTLPLSDGLVRGTVESITEGNTTGLSQASLSGGGQIVSPRLGFGRIVYDVEVQNRYRNYLNPGDLPRRRHAPAWVPLELLRRERPLRLEPRSAEPSPRALSHRRARRGGVLRRRRSPRSA